MGDEVLSGLKGHDTEPDGSEIEPRATLDPELIGVVADEFGLGDVRDTRDLGPSGSLAAGVRAGTMGPPEPAARPQPANLCGGVKPWPISASLPLA